MNCLTVSVLMSTYNRAHLLPEALDSLLAQSRLPDEIIVVDDGSTDHTQAVLAAYGPPVQTIYQENQGPPSARNTGLRAATGDLIAFLDSDDVIPPESIALRAEYLEQHPDVPAVYGAAYMTDMQNNVLGWFRKPPLPQGDLLAEMACRPVFPNHAYMTYRANALKVGFFDVSLHVQDDLDYWIRFAAVYEFAALDVPLAYYRMHDAMSIKTQAEDIIRKGIIAQQRAFEIPRFAQLTPQQQARVYSIHATQHALLGDSQMARHWYQQAIATHPRQLRNYGLWALTFGGRQVLQSVSNIYRSIREHL